MTPLSLKRRRFYAWSLLLLFILVLPLLILYAVGYRFAADGGFFELVETGGMYVGSEEADAEIYIDNELVRETGTFRRAFFVQNLQPGIYTIRVTKEGYYPWTKKLRVSPQVVTEAQAFNMPTEPDLTLIPQWLPTADATTTATTTRLQNPRHVEIRMLFSTSTAETDESILLSSDDIDGEATTTLTAFATSTKEFRGMRLFEDADKIIATWSREIDDVPYYFCTSRGICVEEIALHTKGQVPQWFDFFPGSTDLVVVSLAEGIFVTEIDNRSEQNIQPILISDDADFRVDNGTLYIQESGQLFTVEL